ncbi:hypothetical protein KOR42_52670 [Thalassoglobus neptunius]|uniref:Uncharacterized protein n=1 Tax=Thalassoglobus neptunius TaxID=1938619 RepID=A0A5C5V9T0_9PLAN|nr:hypothetical protein [Thalassoglobus neptunius]TWT35051.1 hypothetical protein KOR42_52670 [Thalassoglobus neptunius]
MLFSESLTVRILGDSSELQRELEQVLRSLDELQERLTESGNAAGNLSQSFSRLSSAVSPLKQIGSLLGEVRQQLRTIGQTPVTLNVSPALQALQQLSLAAMQAATQIQLIPTIPVGGGPGAVQPQTPSVLPPGQQLGPRQRYSHGGLVVGPSGTDRVPTQLSSGEFVLRREIVANLGVGFLERLNSSRNLNRSRQRFESPFQTTSEAQSLLTTPSRVLSPEFPMAPKSAPSVGQTSSFEQRPSQSVANHFGGITIQVRDRMDTERLMTSLRGQGLEQQNRRG